jgi:hypothetical protein
MDFDLFAAGAAMGRAGFHLDLQRKNPSRFPANPRGYKQLGGILAQRQGEGK